MDAESGHDTQMARIAAAIGQSARSRMLCCLLDGHARTSTELAIAAEVTPSSASLHLNRLKAESLVRMQVQGRHRYYCLAGPEVARALEGLIVLAGGARQRFEPRTPDGLRLARSCYDHMAGTVAVRLHDRLLALRWICANAAEGGNAYDATAEGRHELATLGIDVEAARALRRRFAYGCLDWSERRPHLGGALGASLFKLALRKRWMEEDLDSRALSITQLGAREMRSRFGLEV
jgi:DNA-binding transcriptional ArsR family regulator